MEHHRLKKYRGPETWVRVKAAYIAGESAASVALRFDVSVANLRKKASREGWTRSAVGHRRDRDLPDPVVRGAPASSEPAQAVTQPSAQNGEAQPPSQNVLLEALSPQQQMAQGFKLAARRIAEGRPQEAEALVRAARALMEATASPVPTLQDLEETPIGVLETVVRAIEYRAWILTRSLHEPETDPPAASEHFYFHLRDRHFSWADGDRGRDRRWVAKHRPELEALWDEEGQVVEPPAPTGERFYQVAEMLALGMRMAKDGNLDTWMDRAMRDG